MDVEDSILAGYVLVDGPATAVSLAVEKLGLLVVEQPGELVLDGGGGLHQEAAWAGCSICQGIRFILYWGGEAEDRGEQCDQHAGCGGDGHGVEAGILTDVVSWSINTNMVSDNSSKKHG